MLGAWLARYRAMRFQVLFGLLFVALFASSPLRAAGLPGYLFDVLLLASLLSAGLAGLGLGRGFAIVALLALFAASRGIYAFLGGAGVVTASDAFLALAAVAAGIAALREALREGAVTAERLYAATSVYMLAGTAFALVYQGLCRLQPGAFAVGGVPSAELENGTAIYFSFVTLATLGYGDVVPVTPIARSLAVCEAVGAQLFVAVLIARLVGLQSRSRD